MRVSLDSCAAPKCQFCDNPLQHTFVDLGMSPLCERILTQAELNSMEPFYPLHVWVCGKCFLVQVQEYVSPGEIFNDYAYFSSYSDSWLAHASHYVDMATDRFGLGSSSHVV
ncbi:MAG: SAM-dependent methyltransferase, partial [Candidatus Hydrogenedentes bacterium]|nr:SAM-dependent methyltransferase [Candidatus Hydrogenedentota bacterium]